MSNQFLLSVQEICNDQGISFQAPSRASVLHLAKVSIDENYLQRLESETGMVVRRLAHKTLSDIVGVCLGVDGNDDVYVIDTSIMEDGVVRLKRWTGDRWLKSLVSIEEAEALLVKLWQVDYALQQAEPHEERSIWLQKAKQALRPILRDIAIASVFLNLLAVGLPLFIMNVYDRIIPNQATHSLWAMAIGLVIVFLFDFGLRLIRSKYLAISGKLIDTALNNKLFEKAHMMKEDSRSSLSDQLVLFRDFEVVKGFLSSSTLLALADLPFSLVFLALIFALGGAVGIVPLIGMAILIGVSLFYRKRFSAISAQYQQQQGRKNTLLVEALSKQKFIKSRGLGANFQQRWEYVSGEVSASSETSRDLTARLQSITSLVLQFVTLSLIVVGAYAIAANTMSMGALIASVMICSRLMNPIGQLAYLISQLELVKRSFEGIKDWLNLPEEDEEAKTNIAEIKTIELADLTLRDGSTSAKILSSLNLSIRRGERVGIVGRIGSGKSSLLELLMGFRENYSGRYMINGVDEHFIRLNSIRDRLSFVAQQPELVDGILMSQFDYNDIAHFEFTLNELGVSDIAKRLPSGLSYAINNGGRELSGGQRQLIATAAALVKPSDFVILDEPTSSLDNLSERKVANALCHLAGSRGLIIATHRTEILKQLDRIVVLEAGQVMYDGPTEEVLAKLSQTAKPRAVNEGS